MATRRLEELEKKRQAEVLEKHEERALQRHLREMDRATLDDIQRKYGQYIPQGRIERLRQQPARFLRHEEFERHVRQQEIEIPENKRLLGYADDRTHIDREHVKVPRTLAHERLHQVSDKIYRGVLGEDIDEGTTEHFAGKLRGDLHLAGVGPCYPEQRKLVEMLSARVGDDTIAKAYFRGEWNGLQSEVDRQLGDGALAEVSALARQGKFRDAEEIIKKGL